MIYIYNTVLGTLLNVRFLYINKYLLFDQDDNDELIFSRIVLKDRSILDLQKSYTLISREFHLHFGSKLMASELTIKGRDFLLHTGSSLDLSGRGHIAETGQGRGITVSVIPVVATVYRRTLLQYDMIGTGASHAASGSYLMEAVMGVAYGLTRSPDQMGSGGGNGTGIGGSGGGLLNIQMSGNLIIEGNTHLYIPLNRDIVLSIYIYIYP